MSRPPALLSLGFLLAIVVAVTGKDACNDISSNCAAYKFQCNTNSYVQGKCKKTCNLCKTDECIDISPNCAQYAFKCSTDSYVQGRCKKTCDLCKDGSKPATCAILKCPTNNHLCVEGRGSTPATCQCKDGYTEDGNLCLATCATLKCPTNNHLCVEGRGSTPATCQCKDGYTEDGNLCLAERLTDLSSPTINFECGVGYKLVLREMSDIPDVERLPPQPVTGFSDYNGRTRFTDSFLNNIENQTQSTRSLDLFCFLERIEASYLGGILVENNKYPWMALIGQEDKAGGGPTWFCGGVLINRRWVLTAAHCTDKEFRADIVRLGEHDFSREDEGDHEDFKVANVISHKLFNLERKYHDISLIKLAGPVKLRREMVPVCLPWGQEAKLALEGKTATASGWGPTTHLSRDLSPFLNEVDVTVLPIDVCNRNYSMNAVFDFKFDYPQGLGKETLCIGDISNQIVVKSSCPGDSGGPAVIERDGHYTLVGIVSQGYGTDCVGKRGIPGLYVAVQHPPHLAWIKEVAFSPCDSLCVNGNCDPSISSDRSMRCVCLRGWSGEFCDTPICNLPCLRGLCVSPDVCECEQGWIGSQCQTSICNPSCLRGQCVDDRCECEQGWIGSHCQTPCCAFGDGSSDSLSCICDSGWEGDHCLTPICEPPCGTGFCVGPNQCYDPICEPPCRDSFCVAPNQCDYRNPNQ